MKLLQSTDDVTANRKMLKPQVERRRRERMNRSLDSLKTLLLQQQKEPRRRLEKAEVLEHTVLFLRSSTKGNDSEAGGGEKHLFQDGFSTCLQTAAHFLGPEGKGLWLGAALDSTFAARFASPDSQRKHNPHPSSSLSLRQSSRSILRMLVHRSKCRLQAPAVTAAGRSSSTASQQIHTAAGGDRKQSRAGNQSLWRPWP